MTAAAPHGDQPATPLNPHARAWQLVASAPPAAWTISDLAQEMHSDYSSMSLSALRRVVWDCVNSGVLRFHVETTTPAVGINRRRLLAGEGHTRLPLARAREIHRARAARERQAA